MAKSEANEEKKKVIRRLRRIEGQIRGLQRMIEEGGYCEDVLIQLSAVKSAIESLSVAVMESYLKHCFVKEGIIHPEKKQELEQALKVLKRLK
ncbi:metal-sensitive transcriptional regulator [Desulfurobacterium sp.]